MKKVLGEVRWVTVFGPTVLRVDTRVSFVQNSREFYAKRVSYFAKICSLFREISCFAKLALVCESQFRMFRISRNKTFNKRNETKLQGRMKKHCPFQIKIRCHTFISQNFAITARCVLTKGPD